MSNKTNEEKLRILQERLSTIQKKEDIKIQAKTEQSKPVTPVFEEELVNHPNIDLVDGIPRQPKKKSGCSGCFKYFIIAFILFFIILLVGGGGFYAYKNNFKLFTSSDTTEIEQNIIYNKSSFDGNFIIILNTFEKKELANDEAQNLIEKGYNCDVLQLSGVSNSKEEIYQTYIGAFNKKEEANQYFYSTELISESGTIIELQ